MQILWTVFLTLGQSFEMRYSNAIRENILYLLILTKFRPTLMLSYTKMAKFFPVLKTFMFTVLSLLYRWSINRYLFLVGFLCLLNICYFYFSITYTVQYIAKLHGKPDKNLTLEGVFKKFFTKSNAWLCCGSTVIFAKGKKKKNIHSAEIPTISTKSFLWISMTYEKKK